MCRNTCREPSWAIIGRLIFSPVLLEVTLMDTDTALPSTSTLSPANIQLMQLTTACWTSRCLHVIAELGIADLIGDQPQSTDALTKSTGTQPQPLYRVLRSEEHKSELQSGGHLVCRLL